MRKNIKLIKRITIYTSLNFIFFNCSEVIKEKAIIKKDIQIEKDLIEKEDVANLTQYHTNLDSVSFITERGDTNIYPKYLYNQIIDKHPEFFENYPREPKLSYELNSDFEYFGSEAGEDQYFILYAYFLKKKNGSKKYSKERDKLIEIYTHINSIFQRFQYGGTYFGHQYYRILGYAEYSIYIMPKQKSEFDKTYNIEKQKKLYIESLRQLIEDEISIDYETINETDKIERSKKLNLTIDELEKLITNIFYLREAQEFHYNYYGYY